MSLSAIVVAAVRDVTSVLHINMIVHSVEVRKNLTLIGLILRENTVPTQQLWKKKCIRCWKAFKIQSDRRGTLAVSQDMKEQKCHKVLL